MFIVICRGDRTTAPEGHPFREKYPDGHVPAPFEQATRNYFDTKLLAHSYGRGIARGRDPLVIEIPTGILNPRGVAEMVFPTEGEAMEERTARLAYARETGIDWI